MVFKRKTQIVGAKQALVELARRKVDQNTLNEPIKLHNQEQAFFKTLFDKQKNFINNPSKRKAMLGSRQCGKSFLSCAYLAKIALENPRGSCLYLGTSRQKSKELIWNDLQDFDERFSLGFEFNEAELTATHSYTKSKIYLRGCESRKEKEKVRGGRYNLIIVDEAQLLGNKLAEFVHGPLTAATLAKEGTIALLGTPEAKPYGLFYDLTKSDQLEVPIAGWQVFKWTLKDNPHIPKVEEQLENILKNNNWTVTNPHYQREYLGKWVTSHDLLAYKFDYSRNTISEKDLPPDLEFSLGIDFGNNDPSAIVVCGTRPNDNNFYVIDAFMQAELSPTDLSHVIEGYRTRYNTKKMIGDSGGAGKSYIVEYTRHYGLPILNADKQKRNIKIDLLNDDLLTGKLKIVRDTENNDLELLIEELCSLHWKDPLTYTFEQKASDHLSDALRYCHGGSYHYTEKAKKNRLTVVQKANLEIEEHLDKLIAQQNKQSAQKWWQRKG